MFFSFGNTIIQRNVKYITKAGIPKVTAICKYSLCALSIETLALNIKFMLVSVKFSNIPLCRLSGPTPSIGYFLISSITIF